MITHYVSVKVVCVKVLELFSHQLQKAYLKKINQSTVNLENVTKHDLWSKLYSTYITMYVTSSDKNSITSWY